MGNKTFKVLQHCHGTSKWTEAFPGLATLQAFWTFSASVTLTLTRWPFYTNITRIA